MQNEYLYPELVDYIYHHYSVFMTVEEKVAARTIVHLLKENDDIMLSAKKKMGWISEDNIILEMLADGFDAFKNRVVNCIYNEHKNELSLNLCPKCGKIARTPLAKQCRFCFYDWHSR